MKVSDSLDEHGIYGNKGVNGVKRSSGRSWKFIASRTESSLFVSLGKRASERKLGITCQDIGIPVCFHSILFVGLPARISDKSIPQNLNLNISKPSQKGCTLSFLTTNPTSPSLSPSTTALTTPAPTLGSNAPIFLLTSCPIPNPVAKNPGETPQTLTPSFFRIRLNSRINIFKPALLDRYAGIAKPSFGQPAAGKESAGRGELPVVVRLDVPEARKRSRGVLDLRRSGMKVWVKMYVELTFTDQDLAHISRVLRPCV